MSCYANLLEPFTSQLSRPTSQYHAYASKGSTSTGIGTGFDCVSVLLLHHLLQQQQQHQSRETNHDRTGMMTSSSSGRNRNNGYDARHRCIFKLLAVMLLVHQYQY
jgi:hypothetical protein